MRGYVACIGRGAWKNKGQHATLIFMSNNPATNADPVSVIDAAAQLGLGKQAVFKILKRLGVETFKQRHSAHGGQAISYISRSDFDRLRHDIESRDAAASNTADESNGNIAYSETGVFYLIQLEPDHDPGRFKVGFAINMSERLRKHRCAAPFAAVMKTWPCKRTWERAAIDCVTVDCEPLHTEVFRCEDLDSVIKKCDQFFEVMPLCESACDA